MEETIILWGKKGVHPFAYDYVATYFNVVPLEVRKEIQVLEIQIVGVHPYHSNFELIGKDVKWVPACGKFKSRRLHFLNSLVLYQQMSTLLQLVFKDK